MQATAITKAAI